MLLFEKNKKKAKNRNVTSKGGKTKRVNMWSA